MAKVDKLAEMAFDDQCTGANPRYPLIAEIRDVLIASYHGEAYVEEQDKPAAKEPRVVPMKAKG
ncbi:Aldehyde-alcohol dehydrogenase [compost metagenome]